MWHNTVLRNHISVNKESEKNMSKVLPLEWPPIETYQGTSFILGILLAHDNVSNAYYNNYMNLKCNDNIDTCEIELTFIDVSWENYRVLGIAEMDLYNLKNIDKNKLLDFVKERIDQGNYVLFHYVDEYYLSYSKDYKMQHRIHDTYIYGYDEKAVKAMAYKDEKLQTLMINHDELIASLYCNEESDNWFFCTFRPNHASKEYIDYSKVRQELFDYLNSSYSGNHSYPFKVFGLGVYDVLSRSMQAIIDDEHLVDSEIDFRPFRTLWEHKKVLREHILKYIEDIGIANDSLLIKINDIEETANKVFRLIIKFTMTRNVTSLQRVISYLEYAKQQEEIVIWELLSYLQDKM